MFIKNGGNSRLAGYLLAIATLATWMAGPESIGYIPKMIVGTLIYLLGIDLVKEALWDTFGRIHKLEYLMVCRSTLDSRHLLISNTDFRYCRCNGLPRFRCWHWRWHRAIITHLCGSNIASL